MKWTILANYPSRLTDYDVAGGSFAAPGKKLKITYNKYE